MVKCYRNLHSILEVKCIAIQALVWFRNVQVALYYIIIVIEMCKSLFIILLLIYLFIINIFIYYYFFWVDFWLVQWKNIIYNIQITG